MNAYFEKCVGEKMGMIIAVLCVVIILLVAWNLNTIHKMNRKIDKKIFLSQKHFSMFCTMNNWQKAKQRGLTMDNYLLKKGFSKVAIYGMHYLGESLCEELRDTKVEVLYGIDKSVTRSGCDIKIMKPDGELPEVDAIIVTSMSYFYGIKKELREKVNCPIISIDEVIEEMC